jgi:integrase
MRGSVRKRCQCRDNVGRRVRNCRKAHGSWFFVIDVGQDPLTRKRRQITRSGYRTRDEANEAMTKELAALDVGTWTDDQGLTLGAWLDAWLTEFTQRVGSKSRSPKTLAIYRSNVRNFWQPQLGQLRLRDLRRAHVAKALQQLSQRQTGGRRPGNSGSYVELRSGTTVDSYRRTLRAALSVARSRDLISTNPADGRIDAIQGRANRFDDDDDLDIWEPEETARFLEHIAGDRLAAFYELAAYAGLRRGELCGVRWSDLDPDWAGAKIRQTIVDLSRGQAQPGDLICPTCGQEHVGRHFKRPKSKKGRRWVPLAEPARLALIAHQVVQDAERAEFGDDYHDHDLVFCYIDGEPLRPDVLSREFITHAAACGLPPIRLHDMRHGACSLLLSGGVPIEIVQMILGHSSPAVTRQVYAHLMRKASAQQVEVAVRALTEQRREQSVSNAAKSAGSARED